ncbi:MAG: hypothetical protein ACW97X_13865, partial [Candidatus Hodarchaeales archaeon]
DSRSISCKSSRGSLTVIVEVRIDECLYSGINEPVYSVHTDFLNHNFYNDIKIRSFFLENSLYLILEW